MARPVTVSDTTPLIALAWLGRLDLFPALFGVVHIPPAVHREATYNVVAAGADELKSANWLAINPVTNSLAIELLLDQLDLGESEAIVLAHELSADVLLMDERRGRRRAMQSGLRIIGTLGILIEAHERKLADPIRPLLDRLRELPFRMSQALYNEVLQRVGEL